MEEEIKEIELPICPICKRQMAIMKYVGYYDSFTYWQCDCSDADLDIHRKQKDYWKGEYA